MKLFKISTYLFALSIVAFACGKGGDTVETREAAEVAAGSGVTLSLDTDASKVNWRGYKPSGQHFGIIPVVAGDLKVDGNAITAGNFTFDITKLEIHDLEAGSENYGKLWGHLQSDDFFDAQNFPQATFEITSIEPFSAGSIEDSEEFETENTPKSATEIAPSNPTHWVSGNLTMRGTTKNIKFPASIAVNDGGVSAKAGFNIDRTEWGLSYGNEANAVDKAKDQFIYNTVSVDFEINAN
ncbi:YCE I like family protein [Lunatimonas lonarensis]|uniref:YCE I like family protein n=1 Tax=Lunatimonas lonarensis TaxID=1232681 RepID=R7ZNU0_9BACT|nr:YceI family protein [Lunatimonas lonarensis]EON75775.1 YCE I like family protein [Lunatimonas lonarensis]